MPRPRTPTAILKARGSWHASARKGEIEPPRDKPQCPDHLSPAAKAEWDRMIVLLEPVGILSSIDGDQLALYCVAYARWAEAERQITADGTIIKMPNGWPGPHPALAIANTAMKQMHQYLAKFGMTPADRSRVTTSAKATDKSRFFADLGGQRKLRLA